MAGCGSGTAGQFGDVNLVLPATPSANDVGAYFASARGYDEAEGVTLHLQRGGDADFRLVAAPTKGCVEVMAIVRPDKLFLCVDGQILDEQRAEVLAVARTLTRGYTQAQIEPDEAVAATMADIAGLDENALDAAAPTWTEGAPYFGQLAAGPDRDASIAAEAAKEHY